MADLDRMRLLTEAAKAADAVATYYRTVGLFERAKGADGVTRTLIRMAAPGPLQPEPKPCKTGCGRSANKHGTWCCAMCRSYVVRGVVIGYRSHTRPCTRRHEAANQPHD